MSRTPRLLLALLTVALSAAACTSSSGSSDSATSGAVSGSATSAGSSAAPISASPSTKPAPVAKPVHVSLLESDGGDYGVGMPVIAWFDVKPTDMKAFAAATKVTVDGSPVVADWFFETTAHQYSDGKVAALEGHLRMQSYWPAHAKIHVDLPVTGVSAGTGLAFDDSLTLDITTHAANISTVDATTLQMTVTTDGTPYGTFPVSLGAADTPTARGTKVVMDKGADIRMVGPGYDDAHVKFTQRLTYGGEYLHAAPWNISNLGVRSTSNGCTNLSPTAAQQLYGFLGIGDVVNYPNANGPKMTLGAGYGDWNVPWSQWVTGGAVSTV